MKKVFGIVFLVPTIVFLLVACSGTKSLKIWVGVESQEFYAEKAQEYIAMYKEETGENFPVRIEVLAVDTGTAGGVFLNDTTTAGDIITVAHDNLGRLIAGSSAIAPIQTQSLIDQINADNHQVFIDATKGTVQGEEYYFGVPYIAQSLVLYYDKSKISDEQVESWEGILEAASVAEKQALSITGSDGFNNSFLLLAVDEETKSSSLEIYKDGMFENNYATGADVLSFIKYGQKTLFGSTYGAKRPSDSGWQTELQQGHSLSVIGGAWHFNAAYAALGDNLGISLLPTFTLKASDVYNASENQELIGKTYRSGTFADVKMFVKNKSSKYEELLDDILAYFSSKEVQEQSFIAANNLPSYKNAATEFESLANPNPQTPEEELALELALTQIQMFEYGMPQPFGQHVNFNFYYYSKGGPDRIMDILDQSRNTGTFATDAELFAEMKRVENIWKTGNAE